MTRRPLLFGLILVLLSVWVCAACSDSGTEPDASRPTAISLTPQTAELSALGETVQLSAQVRDQNGQAMASASVSWASSAPAIATVDASGLVTAVSNGMATITVTAGSVAGTATVRVAQVVRAVTLSAARDTLVEADTLRLHAVASDANGHLVSGTVFLWVSGNPDVATVDESGLVTSQTAGTVAITATTAGATGSADLIVVPPVPATASVAPDTVEFVALGQTLLLSAEVQDQIGRPIEGAVVSWSTADTAVARVDSAGLVTAVAEGETTVAATAGAAVGSAVVQVMQRAMSVSLSPANATVGLGDTLRIVAEALDENGHRMTSAAFVWQTSDESVAAVDSTGLVSGNGEGSATITASNGEATATSTVVVENPDRAVLVELYEAAGGPNWTFSGNWLTDAPLGDWYGVGVNSAGRVVGITLGTAYDRERGRWESHGFSGSIPPALGRLSQLRHLRLIGEADFRSPAVHVLTGRIPPEIGNLTNLISLELRGNALTGPIPPEVGNLTNIQDLDLSINALTGPIPPAIGNLTNIQTLDLQRNALTGPIPPEIGNLINIRTLDLSTNDLTGEIPSEIGNLIAVWYMSLSGNRFVSPLPPELASLSQMTTLSLGGNYLTSVPRELGNLTNLRDLFLDFNVIGHIPPELGQMEKLELLHLSGNRLSAIPGELGNLSSLKALDLARNLLSAIPRELGNLSSLKELDLSRNRLSAIPGELGNLSSLTKLDLRSNALVSMPKALGSLVALEELHLDNNDLTSFPDNIGGLANLTFVGLTGNNLERLTPGIGNLKSLRVLDLSGHSLTSLPPTIDDLVSLEILNVSNNALNAIPDLGDLTMLKELYLQDNALSGPVPSEELGNLSSLEILDLDGNQLSGPFPLNLIGKWPKLHSIGVPNGVCLPGSFDFLEWWRWSTRWELCNLDDIEVLRQIYMDTGGSDWISRHGWSDDAQSGVPSPPVEQWYGVAADSLGRVVGINLSDNGLNGLISTALGSLNDLVELNVSGNGALTGSLPQALARLSLKDFRYAGTGLCVPEDDDFRRWLNAIPVHRGSGASCDSLSDREILERLYRYTNPWLQSDNWATDAPLEDWYGVSVDGEGRVVELDLSRNFLEGPLPVEIGQLANLRSLNLAYNRFFGVIPAELGMLVNLEELFLTSDSVIGLTRGSISIGRSTGGTEWTGSIPPELGNLTNLRVLDLRGRTASATASRLEGPVPAELGNLSSLEELYLSHNELTSIPAELGRLGNLRVLNLQSNDLTGLLPSELGKLASLERLYLNDNALSGPIPAALGGLASLEGLHLQDNALTAIPPELGRLGSLWELYLQNNALAGPIPATLGGMTVFEMDLSNNALTGPIPAELGGMTVFEMDLSDNALTGPIPGELGRSVHLRELWLSGNEDLSGPLPTGLTALRDLSVLAAGETRLCASADAAMQAWLVTIERLYLGGSTCSAEIEGAAVYLVQAVQGLNRTVPLIAGRKAQLRVFPTAPPEVRVPVPPVRAVFYDGAAQVHSVVIPGKPGPLQVKIGVSQRYSANVEIPGDILRPGLEMVVEIDPNGTLDPALGIARRLPAEGRIALDIRRVPPMELTLVPFLPSGSADSTVVSLVQGIASDPVGHETFHLPRSLLPVSDWLVTAHEPVQTDGQDGYALLSQTAAIRAMEGGRGYWQGIANVGGSVRGVAYQPGWISFSEPDGETMVHELGHNLSLGHAPCGGPEYVDSGFPHPNGRIGAVGYDFSSGQTLIRRPDFMGYCGNPWVSDYHFGNALRHRQRAEPPPAPAVAALLLWGGVDSAGTPQLQPAFVVDAPPLLPEQSGPWTVEGQDAAGRILFSLTFAMPEVADAGVGTGNFAYTLPIRPGWETLADITLSGPNGTATLDGSTDRPMTIIRDGRTGQVRAILGDDEALAADATGSLEQVRDLVTLTSRGLPGPSAWRRE